MALTLIPVLAGLLFIYCDLAAAQQRTPRVGFLGASGDNTNRGPNFEAFRNGLEELGYRDGKTIILDYRSTEGKTDRAPALVTELLESRLDVLFVGHLAGTQAAKKATTTIPIVMVSPENPVEIGLIKSFAHPGGNLTGLTTSARDLSGKRLELLQQVLSTSLKVGVLWDANAPGPPIAFKEYDAVARSLKIPLQSLEVQGPTPDLEGAFAQSNKARSNALIVIRNPVVRRNLKVISELAIKNRLLSMAEGNTYVEAGLTMSYAADEVSQHRRAAYYVEKILKGAKPADLPIEQPTKFELVINLKTAKQIGLTIPPNVLARADRVIK